MLNSLRGKVAVVTGASRNAGRGIALVLGKVGATVYVTGRSVRSEQTTDIPGANIEDTAEQVTARGGIGIPVRCDHSIDEEVKALFDRVKQEQERLDILVNNAWGGYETIKKVGENADWGDWTAPFWKQPLSRWDVMFRVGVRSHMVSSYFAMPLMLPHRQGLIVNTTFWDRDKYHPPLPYYLAKATINRMAYVMALELREHNITVVALSPGWLRGENILQKYQTDDLNAHKVDDLVTSESTQYIGRAVVALATDPDVVRKSGNILTVGDLAQEYGFTDVDGRQVPPFKMPEEHLLD